MSSTVLITWASSGIGLEFARICANEGHDLVLVARSWDKLHSLATELSAVSVTVIEKDLALMWAWQDIYEELIAKNIYIDILINNAGFWDYGEFHTLDLSRQLQMIDLNMRTLTELTYLFGKDMVAKGAGKILNVASTAAFEPGPLMSVYFATKNYVLAFSEGIREEWVRYGVTVTTLCPGPTESAFAVAARATENQIFSKKLPTSQEVAQYGYESLMAGKSIAIHWWMNRLLSVVVWLIPRGIVTKMMYRMQSK